MISPLVQAAMEAAKKYYRGSSAPHLLIKEYAYSLGFIKGHAVARAESEAASAQPVRDLQRVRLLIEIAQGEADRLRSLGEGMAAEMWDRAVASARAELDAQTKNEAVRA